RTTWTGPVAGSVGRTYDDSFRVNGFLVNGADPIDLRYDDDDLVIGAGTLSIRRAPETGAVIGTTLGGVAQELAYDEYGDVARIAASFGAGAIFSESYARDRLGRIVQSGSDRYSYDALGRLGGAGFDANGNRTSGTAVYDAQDRL